MSVSVVGGGGGVIVMVAIALLRYTSELESGGALLDGVRKAVVVVVDEECRAVSNR